MSEVMEAEEVELKVEDLDKYRRAPRTSGLRPRFRTSREAGRNQAVGL
jgi:hypothetical protein